MNPFNPKYSYRLYSNHTKEEAIKAVKRCLELKDKEGKKLFLGKTNGDTFFMGPTYYVEPKQSLRPDIRGRIIEGSETVIELGFSMQKGMAWILRTIFLLNIIALPFIPFILSYFMGKDPKYAFIPHQPKDFIHIAILYGVGLVAIWFLNIYVYKTKVKSSLEILVKELRTTKKEDLS